MEGNPNAETSWNVDGMDRHALNFASDAQAYGPSGAVVRNQTMREESGYESGRRRTALTSEKMAVFAPIPTASVRTATSVKPGLRRHPRSAYRTSCATWPTSFFASAMWRERTSARSSQSTSQHADTVRLISRRSGRVGALERRQVRSANQHQQVAIGIAAALPAPLEQQGAHSLRRTGDVCAITHTVTQVPKADQLVVRMRKVRSRDAQVESQGARCRHTLVCWDSPEMILP